MAPISTWSTLAPPDKAPILARRKSGSSIVKRRLRYSGQWVLCVSSMLFLLAVLATIPVTYMSNWKAKGVMGLAEDDNLGDKPNMEELMAQMKDMGGMQNFGGMGRLEDVPSASESSDSGNVIEISDEEDVLNSGFHKVSEEQKESIEAHKEKHQYQAEVTRLMDIIINSLYTQKEVFLRELISNSADALERIRFKALDDSKQLEAGADLHIKIDINREDKVLSIQDTGIGMTKNDLINNLGTVAKSGTSNFLEALSKGGDINLIGQFGVGFYSAFLVADKVTVYSKSNDDENQYIWESSADGSFTITVDPKGNTLGRGTRLFLHLKEDATDFLNEGKVKDLVTKYSQFISYPIYVKHEKKQMVEVDDEDAEAADTENKGDEEAEVKDVDEEAPKKKKKKVEKVKREWKQVNLQKSIWLRPKEDITDEEYKAFYKSISKDYQDPLTYIHFTGEGEIEFKSVLFIPNKAPMDMFDNYFNKQTSVNLYVRRVLVADQFDDILPKYLHFVRGVIDSDDLPLNVSREQLQQHKIMKVISKKLVRKILELLKKISKDGEDEMAKLKEELENEEDAEAKKAVEKKMSEGTKFDKVWKEFSRNLKLGCYEDDANRSKISKILRFYTSKSPDAAITLDKFIENMKEGNGGNTGSLYFASGESVTTLMKLPQIQIFMKKGIEVLLLTEAMDEPCVQKLTEYEGKKFESIQKGEVNLEQTPDEQKHEKKLKKVYKPLLDWIKDKLSGKISKVDVSRRLVTDPVAVVSSSWGYSAYMEKIMKTQTFADTNQVKMMMGQKQLEINPTHPVVYDLLKRVKTDKDDAKALDTLRMLFQTAMFASGFDVEEPTDLSARVYEMIGKEVGVNVSDAVEVDVSEVEDEVEEVKPADGDGEDADIDGTDAGGDADDADDVGDVGPDVSGTQTEHDNQTPEDGEEKKQPDTHDEL